MISQTSDTLPRLNRVAIGETLAVMFCPAPDGKMFGVTVDRDDLSRIQSAGFWRVANFQSSAGNFSPYCYLTKKIDGKFIYLHRFLLNVPKGKQVDHCFNRRLDNRKSEIRIATGTLNQLNRLKCSSPNRFGLRGVAATRSGRYRAAITVDGHKRQLGTFDTPQEAGEMVRQFLIENGAAYAASRPVGETK